MTYASKLLKTMELTDFPGSKKIRADIIDEIVERRIIAENRNRYVCNVCFTMTSTSKTCYCNE